MPFFFLPSNDIHLIKAGGSLELVNRFRRWFGFFSQSQHLPTELHELWGGIPRTLSLYNNCLNKSRLRILGATAPSA
jgi:uncharacterized membrane protein (DUF2068 family)